MKADVFLEMSSEGMVRLNPGQPDHLSEDVKSLLKQMHDDPKNAGRLFSRFRSQHKEELNFEGAKFYRLPLGSSGADFGRLKLNGSTFQGCDLESVPFRKAVLEGATFQDCDFRRTNLEQAALANAEFLTVQFYHTTRFQSPESIAGCTMDRYALACLSREHGGLTEGNLMDMNIVDHVAELRLKFSGYWAWIHMTSIIVFFFPYAWFLIQQWSRARFMEADEMIPLYEALGRFIWNGGKDWKGEWNLDFWAVLRFGVVSIYQIVRVALLAKTKSLEMEQVVKGLPAKFSLDEPLDGLRIPYIGWAVKAPYYELRKDYIRGWKIGIAGRGFRWRWALVFVQVFIVFVVLSAIFNAFHFLQMSVPVEAGN